MAYTIKYHGFDVVCETVADLRALVSQNGSEGTKAARPARPAPANESVANERTGMAALIARMPKEYQELLRFVVTAHAPVSRDRLRELVGVKDTHKFAGLLIGISKFAEHAKLTSPLESLWERHNGTGERTYHYKIRDEVQAEVKEALGK